MKNTNYLFLLIAVITLTGCKKDENQPEVKNELLGKWKRHVSGTFYDFQLRPSTYDITYIIEFGETSFSYYEDYYIELIEDTTVNDRWITVLNGTYNLRGDRLVKTDITSATWNGEPDNRHIGQKYYLFTNMQDSITFTDCTQWKRLTGNPDQMLNSSFYDMSMSTMNEVTIYYHRKIQFSNDSVDIASISNHSPVQPTEWQTPPPFDAKLFLFDDYYKRSDWGNDITTFLIYNSDLYQGGSDKNYIRQE